MLPPRHNRRYANGPQDGLMMHAAPPASAPGSTRTNRITPYTAADGENGRIYQTRGWPGNLRWFWSLTVDPPMARSNRVASLEEAKEGNGSMPARLSLRRMLPAVTKFIGVFARRAR